MGGLAPSALVMQVAGQEATPAKSRSPRKSLCYSRPALRTHAQRQKAWFYFCRTSATKNHSHPTNAVSGPTTAMRQIAEVMNTFGERAPQAQWIVAKPRRLLLNCPTADNHDLLSAAPRVFTPIERRPGAAGLTRCRPGLSAQAGRSRVRASIPNRKSSPCPHRARSERGHDHPRMR